MEPTEMISEPVAKLRQSVKTRFKNKLMGYDPVMVDEYVTVQQQVTSDLQEKLDEALAACEEAQNCASTVKRKRDIAEKAAKLRECQLEEQLRRCTEALEIEQDRVNQQGALALEKAQATEQSLRGELEQLQTAAQEAQKQLQIMQQENERRLQQAAEEKLALAQELRMANEEVEALRGRITQNLAGVASMKKYRTGELEARLREALELLHDDASEDQKALEQLREAVQQKSPS